MALGSSMLSPDQNDEGTYANKVSALEEQVKELKNDLSLKLA